MVPAARTIQYGYAQTGWKDLMTSYNGQSITYDEIGNPLTYRDGMTMTWAGRQLTSLTQNGKQNTYKYDVDGLRLEKTAGGVTTQYQYVNGQLLGEKRSNGVILRYTYDALGALSGILITAIQRSTQMFHMIMIGVTMSKVNGILEKDINHLLVNFSHKNLLMQESVQIV